MKDILLKLKFIVENHQAEEITWDDGTLLVDVQTANVMIKVHEGLQDTENKEFMVQKISESKESFIRMTQFAWKMVK